MPSVRGRVGRSLGSRAASLRGIALRGLALHGQAFRGLALRELARHGLALRGLSFGGASSRGLQLLAIAGWLALGMSTSHAHLGHVVVRAERYLKLDLEPTQARFVVSLTLGPEETVRVLSAADTDADGTLTQAEADAYMAEWGRGLQTELPFELDGDPIVLSWEEPWLTPIGPIERVPGTVEMVARIPLDPGTHTLRWHDGMRVETFDRTDVAVTTTGPDLTLVRTGAGEDPIGITERFAYGPQNAPTVVTTVVEVPGTPPLVRWLGLGVGALVVLAALASWARLWRRRGR